MLHCLSSWRGFPSTCLLVIPMYSALVSLGHCICIHHASPERHRAEHLIHLVLAREQAFRHSQLCQRSMQSDLIIVVLASCIFVTPSCRAYAYSQRQIIRLTYRNLHVNMKITPLHFTPVMYFASDFTVTYNGMRCSLMTLDMHFPSDTDS